MLTISTIPEALAELGKQTGRTWTDAELFDVASANEISLHAAPPITAETTIQEFVTGEGLRERYRMRPGRAALAVLFPWQVGQLWISGETETTHPSDHDSGMEGQYHWFTEPVRVTREQVRIKAETLQKILTIWRDAQTGKARPHRIRPAWIAPPITPQDMGEKKTTPEAIADLASPLAATTGAEHDERTHAVNELREWLNLDTWTVREGLLLLAGIDPHRSDCWKLTEQGFETATQPAWARITASPGLSVDDVDGSGMPRITGLVLDLNQAVQLSKLLNLWVSKPGHALQDRRAPRYYIEWATNKGHPPFWKPWVFDAGLLLEQPTTALFDPEVASTVDMDSRTDKERRQDRRLMLLCSLGGKVARKSGELRVFGITALENSEKAAGAGATSTKTIRADLKAAYERQAQASRAGPFSRLGSQ